MRNFDLSTAPSTWICNSCKRNISFCTCSSSIPSTAIDNLNQNYTCNFDLNNLVSNLIIHRWQRHCVISKTKLTGNGFGTIPLKLIVSYTSNDGTVNYLRYSTGPSTWFFWDVYGDDFLNPEIALLAISKCPPPPNVERDHL